MFFIVFEKWTILIIFWNLTHDQITSNFKSSLSKIMLSLLLNTFPHMLELTGFELAICNSRSVFGSLRMSFCIFSKNCESLKSDTLWIFRLIHWNSYILSYFKPIKYPPVEQFSQRFIVYINFRIHTFFSSYHFVTI